jgi:hypothetical protein
MTPSWGPASAGPETNGYQTLDDVVDGFAGIEARLRAGNDRRSMFLTLYGVVSAEMRDRVAGGAFADPAWVERYAVAFANLYRVALEAYDAGRPGVPRAWRLCFDAAKTGSCTVLQDVLLGVNAHVNNDLAFALDRVSIGPDRESRRHDHNAVNDVLSAVTDRATRHLSSLYAPGITTMAAVAGDLDEIVSRASLDGARDAAWQSACALADARGPVERGLAAARVSTRASVLARVLLAPLRRPDLMAVCRRLEEEANWLTLLDELKTR